MTTMSIWAVSFSDRSFTDDVRIDHKLLYEAGLVLVDPESQARIKRFYFRNDSYRCLLGRLLPRLLLKRYGIPPKEAAFGRTASGKPYVKNPSLEHTIGFNVSHDNEYIVMAFQIHQPSVDAPNETVPQTYDKGGDVTTIGVDVMKVALPRYEKNPRSFIHSISDTLTSLEQHSLLEHSEANDALRRLYLVWTLKEAYTKALGLGLGFNFKRIEVDISASRIYIDGSLPLGWEFRAFSLESQSGDEYQVAIARFTGEKGCETQNIWGHVDVRGRVDKTADVVDWFAHYDAEDLITRIAECNEK
ncbi:hypothetical protein ACEPAH_5941 [Sanghuangporus vaninii]